MLLSHHPPSQYERTLHIAGYRCCARCSGVIIGVLVGAPILRATALLIYISVWHFLCIAVVTLVFGVVAFVRNESGSRQSNNYERIAFGVVIGTLLPISWAISPWYFAVVLALLAVGQFASAFVLRRAGLLDRFFSEYLEGAMVSPSDEAANTNKCGRLFCACKPGVFQFPKA